jgi:hypothetical protein
MNPSHCLTASDEIWKPTLCFTSETRVLFPHATEHSGILDRDRRLASKRFDERAFFICEQLDHLLSVEVYDTQHFTMIFHRNAQYRLDIMDNDALYRRERWILTDIHRMHCLSLECPTYYRATKRRQVLEFGVAYASRTCNLHRSIKARFEKDNSTLRTYVLNR